MLKGEKNFLYSVINKKQAKNLPVILQKHFVKFLPNFCLCKEGIKAVIPWAGVLTAAIKVVTAVPASDS